MAIGQFRVRMTITMVLAVLGLIGGSALRRVSAQAPVRIPQAFGHDRAKILTSVARFRRTALGDTARIRYCNALEVAGDSASLQYVLASLPRGSSLFKSCEVDKIPNRHVQRIIIVDSMAVKGQMARVHTTVIDPAGPTYRETYELTNHGPDRPWFVLRAQIATGIILHRPSRR